MDIQNKLFLSSSDLIQLFSLIAITLFLSIYIIKFILKDIKKGIINSSIIPIFALPVIVYYFIPIIFIVLCSVNSLCWSIELNSSVFNKGLDVVNILEKYIYLKYLVLMISSLGGFQIGFLLFKKYYKNKLSYFKFIKNFNLKEIKIKNKLGKGIFFSYIFFSIFLILIAVLNSTDLYYIASFGRLYSIYNFFLFTPAILIGFGLNKIKDLTYLGTVLIFKALVLNICLGRTFQSSYLFLLGFSIINIAFSLKFKKNFFDFSSYNVNKIIKFGRILLCTSFLYIFLNKFMEIVNAINYWTFQNKLYKPLVYTQMIGRVIGSPEMVSKHFLNSINRNFPIEILNLFFSQFHPILYPPYLSSLLPNESLKWYTNLSDNLLGLEINQFGGSTFGSGLAFYSYFPWQISIIFIILFSALNAWLLYFLGNKIELSIQSKTMNLDYRNYFFICTILPFNETWGGSLFPSGLIWLLATHYIISQFVNFSKSLKILS